MNGRNNNNLLSLLGGAAAGAIAMYLLDPEQGPRRREHLSETAGEALKGTGAALGTAWEGISEGAKTAAATLATGAAATGEYVSDTARDFSRSNPVRHARHAAGDAGSYLSSLGHDLIERARGLGQRFASGAGTVGHGLADTSRDAADWTRDTASSAKSSVASMFGREEEESHTLSYAMGAVATLALGASAMYFLDPQRGRTRRAWAGGRVNRIVNDTGRAFRQAGQMCNDALNRTRGTAHELRGSVAAGGPVTAEQLLQRVRSEMGHVVSHAGQIQVMTDATGHVELTGRVLASELDDLLTCVRRVNGVNQVTNRLEIVDRADQMSAGGGQMGTAIPQM